MQNNVEHVEEASGETEGLIKTPRQLVTVIILAFLIPIIAILLLVKLVAVTSPMGAGSRAQSSEAIAERIQPVARFKLVEATADGGDTAARTGQQVYDLTCATCHAAGVAGAPTLGDEAAWAPLIESGFDEMVRIAIEGVGAMPPRGGNSSLSDLEVARAVAYMANNSGGSFDEPTENGSAAADTEAAATDAPAAAPEQEAPESDAAAATEAAEEAEVAETDAAAQPETEAADTEAAQSDEPAQASADSASADAPTGADIQPILTKNACLACHAVENKLIGPSYREVAEKYAGDDSAAETIAQHIKGGSSGIWGPVPMPPNPGVSDEELAQIVTWIMAGAPE